MPAPAAEAKHWGPDDFSARDQVVAVKDHFCKRRDAYRAQVKAGKMPAHVMHKQMALWSAIVISVEKGSGYHPKKDAGR